MNLSFFFSRTFLAAIIAPIIASAQGQLTPPGPPAPLFKTLDQVEPRIPVESLPAGGSAKHAITQPGSYFLTGNLIASTNHGIYVATNNVTIDLGGFVIFTATNRSAVLNAAALTTGLRVLNGRILNCGTGVNCPGVSNVVVEGVDVRCGPGGSFRYGIRVGPRSSVRRCHVGGADGTSSVGISAGADSAVENCGVDTSQRGISIDSGCRVDGCIVIDCPNGDGIFGLSVCMVRQNRVERCDGGIRVSDNSIVSDNLVVSTGGSGFYLAGSYNRLERNCANFNQFGFQTVSGSTNFVVQNTAHGNTNGNFSLLGSEVSGPTVTTIGIVTNHPWANFSF